MKYSYRNIGYVNEWHKHKCAYNWYLELSRGPALASPSAHVRYDKVTAVE